MTVPGALTRVGSWLILPETAAEPWGGTQLQPGGGPVKAKFPQCPLKAWLLVCFQNTQATLKTNVEFT